MVVICEKDTLEDWKHFDVANLEVKLVNVVSATLITQPRYYSTVDETKLRINATVGKLAKVNPEFVLKVIYYLRNRMNIRSTSNCKKKKQIQFILNMIYKI